MVEEQWRSSAWRTLDDLAGEGLSGTSGLARALVTVATLLKTVPLPTRRRHGYVAPDRFKALVEAAKVRLIADDFSSPRDNETVEELFAVLASQLAALDGLHHKLVGDLEPAFPNEDWLVEHPGGAAFLIPRGGLYRRSEGDAEAESEAEDEEEKKKRSGQMVIKWRDLMPHHRILPTHLEGMAIELHWKDMGRAWPHGAELGAGFFTDLTFVDDLSERDFLIADIACADQDQQIERLLAAGQAAGCAALVLPELTMPLDRVAALQDRLRLRINWADPDRGNGPGLVMAGSWHTPMAPDGEIGNVAPVFDAYGEPLLKHAKFLAFNALGAPERIAVGDRIHVLVTEEVLISFGICLDFCERQEGMIFPLLDIDYALVTSCGADATMQGHIDTAKDMITRFRSRAFVVQHRYPPFPGKVGEVPIGYVLPPRDDETLTPASTLVTAPFSVHATD